MLMDACLTKASAKIYDIFNHCYNIWNKSKVADTIIDI